VDVVVLRGLWTLEWADLRCLYVSGNCILNNNPLASVVPDPLGWPDHDYVNTLLYIHTLYIHIYVTIYKQANELERLAQCIKHKIDVLTQHCAGNPCAAGKHIIYLRGRASFC